MCFDKLAERVVLKRLKRSKLEAAQLQAELAMKRRFYGALKMRTALVKKGKALTSSQQLSKLNRDF